MGRKDTTFFLRMQILAPKAYEKDPTYGFFTMNRVL